MVVMVNICKAFVFDKRCKKFMAQCYVHGENIHIGNYNTEGDASKAYREYKSEHLICIAKSQPDIKVEKALIRHAKLLFGDKK